MNLKNNLKHMWYIFMYYLGFTPTVVANEWAMQATRYRQYLYELKKATPHDTIKQEIDDVLHPQNDADL